MSYDDLKVGRRSLPGHAYFVTIVTFKRKPLFSDLYLARCVIREMRRMHGEGDLDSMAWVLMPDHLHWLFQLGDRCDLGNVIARFKGVSARRLNQHLGMGGHIWQRGFYDRAIRANEDPITVARYMVGNPLRAGLVDSIEDYPHWDARWL
ncbi:transposase [Pontibacterium granulatum]|uniref:REP-associated tyrosine transposase n=1 Tax=Pontibacterium granulatum TaxID=2036029 RepID=UPI00249AC732|nr:transposase [Pontibacterium granulatum]MDI3325979.1 transposase [Pontibacterium granulatum]